MTSSRFDDVSVERLRRRRTVKWSLYGPDVLAAWVAEMDFDVAKAVKAALLDAVEREDFGYVEADTSELTDAAAAFFTATYGWEVSPRRVFLVADVLAGIAGALGAFVPAGAPVVLPTPAYPPLFDVIELSGRPVVPVAMIGGDGGGMAVAPAGPGDPASPGSPRRSSETAAEAGTTAGASPAAGPPPTSGTALRAAVLDLERIDAALAAGARAVLLTNPHNPTGRVFTAGELQGLAAVVDRHGGRVIADEVHGPLTSPGHPFVPYASVSDAAAEHAVTVISASKAWNLAGLKCAQVVATNHDDADQWRRLPLFAVPGPSPLGIAASVAAYRDGLDARGWLADLVAYLDGNRRRLVELVGAELPGVRLHPPEGTFLAWLDCAALGLEDPARFFLDEARVALSDGPPYGGGLDVSGPGGGASSYAQHVRLNFATSAALLDRIVGSMGEALRRR
ncbi:MAG: aminotransferase class I/II-fold pyridoxal phosphate-dependent enzyme [Acidimicrobiales bacterium]|nr:aminotransferase class I/II-fold pyridoxal phosphate-dependent enzyme [Acidimicrobiales bacterium]